MFSLAIEGQQALDVSSVYYHVEGERPRLSQVWGKPRMSTQLAAALAVRCCMHPNRAQRDQLKADLRTFLTGLARIDHEEMVVNAWALDKPVPWYFSIL